MNPRDDVVILRHENNHLKKELHSLNTRLETLQNTIKKQHETIRELKLKAGAHHVGPYVND